MDRFIIEMDTEERCLMYAVLRAEYSKAIIALNRIEKGCSTNHLLRRKWYFERVVSMFNRFSEGEKNYSKIS